MKPRWIHEAFKRLFSGILIRIRSGPLRGRRFILSTGSRFLQGRYEPAKTAALTDLVRPGDVVFDVGAHVGYFTLLCSDLAGPRGRVIAFEPRPLNLRFLRRHLRVNGCVDAEVLGCAVGERDGSARFETRTGTGTGRISPRGNLQVELWRLDSLVESGRLPWPDLIKIDVEGGEMEVLAGARRVLEQARPRLLVATHGSSLGARVRAFLEERGYDIEVLAQPRGDPELIGRPRAVPAPGS